MNRLHPKRRGAITVVVLVCMLIATTLAASTLHSALRGRRETQRLRQLRQTDLLLDAGALRAAERLQRDDAYRGETWRPSDAISGEGTAVVKIDVSGDDTPRQIDVVASIQPHTDSAARTQRSMRFAYP